MENVKEKGITLIALVVTIVVLLILAGISIGMLAGEDGIIRKAIKSKEDSIIGEEKDAIALAYSSCKVDNMMENVTETQLQTQLSNNGYDTTVTSEEEKLKIKFNGTKHIYTIDQNGKIDLVGSGDIEDPESVVDLVTVIYDEGTSSYKFYVLTAGGEVKLSNIEDGYMFDKLETSEEETITTNGVRKKGKSWFIDNAGKLYVWGSGYNELLGIEGEESIRKPIYVTNLEDINVEDIYEYIDDDLIIKSMIVKDNHGKLYSWGYNDYGNLGYGTDGEYISEPICISDIDGSALKGKNITNIYSEGYTILAIDNSAKLYSWGYNSGSLGYETEEEYSSVPTCISDIEGNALKGKNIKNLYVCGDTIIAIDNSGKLYTWGDNYYGQLGYETVEYSNSLPICISDIAGNALKGKNIIEVKSYGYTIIARDSNGKLYTWGDNEDGMLGYETEEFSSEPMCISDIVGSALNDVNITDIYSKYQSIIARDNSGKLYTWGNNDYCQLGYESREEYSSTPICISDMKYEIQTDEELEEILEEDSALKGKNITDIYMWKSDSRRISTIVKDIDGKLYTWGNNTYGQLGGSTSSSRPTCISDIDGNELKGKNITDIFIWEIDTERICCNDNNKR